MESHTLSLRKKLNNKAKKYILPNFLTNELTYEINIPELEQKISNEQLYMKFINSADEKNSLNLLFQMLLNENNDNILKFSLANLKKFLISIDEQNFESKNLSSEFNDKFIKYLYDLLLKKANDFYILSNISFILNKLSNFLKNEDDYYFKILFDNFTNILNLANSINLEEPQVKNLLYLLSSKLFLTKEEMISKIEKAYPSYIKQIHQELIKMDENKFVKNMLLISTLLNILNNFFYYKIYGEYFFAPFNNDMSMNEINIEHIFKYIQKLMNFSYQMEIFEQELRCIQNFLYLFMGNEQCVQNTQLKQKIKKIIQNLQLDEKIVPLIYDSTVNETGLRVIALQILVNATFLCSKKFCEKLIESNIAAQIIKLEQFLINQMQMTKRAKHLYKLLIDLIYNLIENESKEIIDNLSIENNCISLLFKLQEIPFYSSENKKYMIKIFYILIQSNHKFIQTFLISEGICEWYKTILKDDPTAENIEMIITNFITMVKFSANLVKDDNNKNNLLLIHLEKIGILELIMTLKSRNDLSDEVMTLLNDFCSLFK